MTRPWQIWTVFLACVIVIAVSVIRASVAVLRLDRAESAGREQAEFEEKVRLALWRMDSSLMALIVEESARPVEHYQAFAHAPGAYTKGLTGLRGVPIPSPLLAHSSSNVLLHFRLAPDGSVTSPQAPASDERQAATNQYAASQNIITAGARLAELQNILRQRADPASAKWMSAQEQSFASNADLLRNSAASRGMPVLSSLVTRNSPTIAQAQTLQTVRADSLLNLSASELAQQQAEAQTIRNSAEFNARANVYQQVAQADSNVKQPVDPVAAHGLLKPTWIGSSLVLSRIVRTDGAPLIQGVWINWPHVKASLQQNIADLFPEADLRPVVNPENARGSRILATVPIELFVQMSRSPPVSAWTPLRVSLFAVWTCLLLAALAVAGLLHGAISLSERRGAFVSAVTHELRTPLTTFKMYSEMLAGGMVPDERRRGEYLATLCSEANRLSHLVENVLAYARLERGSARSRVERVTLGELIGRVRGRLEERATRSEMTLVVDADANAAQTPVHVDVAAVEQILFNLVDNACKYAAPTATEKSIHLEAFPDGKFAMLRVRDHGQGISGDSARRLFKPFSKSAQEAAHSAPGIGLGLALCRRLSRSIGGDLRLNLSVTPGACFELRLPITAAAPVALDSI